jgi:uncharacterized protein (TIGR03435 family)
VRMSDGGPGSHDPTRYSFGRATLHDLLYTAWNLEDYQQISGPGWLASEPYDIEAKIPPGTTKDQFRQMLQNLLAERFKLKLHVESRDFPVFELVVGKNGPKLTESVEGRPMKPPEGFPEPPANRPGYLMHNDASGTRMSAHEVTMAMLVHALRHHAGRVLVDKTGLTGKYDFTLQFNEWEGRPPVDDPSPSLSTALQQLGLKQVDGKAPFDFLVIEHVEKVPTEN